MTDPLLAEITEAVTIGRAGDSARARALLLPLWERLNPTDAFHRCVLAHYLADLYAHPAEALVWDVRALDAAAGVTDDDFRQLVPGGVAASFYPSLHLNVADQLRQLGAFEAAAAHLDAAHRHTWALGDDPYGATIRSELQAVAHAVESRDGASRAPDSPKSGR